MEQQASERKRLAQASNEMHGKVADIKAKVQAIKHKLANTQPGQEYVLELAAAMDEGEQAITVLKEEQRINFEDLVKQVGHDTQVVVLLPYVCTWLSTYFHVLEQDRLYTRDIELMMERMESSAWEITPEAPPKPAHYTQPVISQQACILSRTCFPQQHLFIHLPDTTRRHYCASSPSASVLFFASSYLSACQGVWMHSLATAEWSILLVSCRQGVACCQRFLSLRHFWKHMVRREAGSRRIMLSLSVYERLARGTTATLSSCVVIK